MASVYGITKYGTSLYGDSSGRSTTNLFWAIEVDWDGDGIYEGYNEAPNAISLSVRRGRDSMLNQQGAAFNDVDVGKTSIVLENHDGKYDPRNTSGLYYPNILPGRLIRVKVKVGHAGTYKQVFHGRITDIRPISGNERRVRIDADDGIRALLDISAQTTLYQTLQIDEAITVVLSAVRWPSLWGSSIESASDAIRFWWMNAGESAWSAISRLAATDFGIAFVSASGALKFYSRQHAASDILTLTDSTMLKEINFPQPWENVRTEVEVVANPTTVSAVQVPVYATMQPIAVDAGETETFWFNYNTYAGFSLDQPVAGFDWIATSDPNAGSDLTSSFSITVTEYPQKVRVVIRNSGGTDGYVNYLVIRGYSVIAEQPRESSSIDLTAEAVYGPRLFRLNTEWMQDENVATNLPALILAFLKDAAIHPTVQLEAQPDTQFNLELFDRITLNSAGLDLNTRLQVGGIEHRWLSENGQAVLTTLNLEPFFTDVAADIWKFTATIGTSSKFAT